jgi:hypothetical protein
VSGPLAGVRDFFLAPPAAARPTRDLAIPSPGSFVVLGEKGDALAVAGGLVLAGGSCGVTCVWPSDEPLLRAPATRDARRLARRLESRALSCVPVGRLVRVALPAAPAEAVATARRAAAAAPTACAIALSGPRDADLDGLLALQDAVVLVARAGADSALVRLALAGLTAMGPPATAVAPPTGISRRLGLAGVAVLPRLRAEIGDALA